MQITTLIENDVADQHTGLVAEWGLSLRIKHQDKKILFDTGAKGALVRNAERQSMGNCAPGDCIYVNSGGHTEHYTDEEGRQRVKWVPVRLIKGVAYDNPISGYRGTTVNMLRLWKSEAVESFDFESFNTGDYYAAVNEKVISETISKVLYPNDEPDIGKRLRLAQQYFFVSCSLQDMIRVHLLKGTGIKTFHKTFAAQLNDTHPSVAVAELMRLLLDEHGLDWRQARRRGQARG